MVAHHYLSEHKVSRATYTLHGTSRTSSTNPRRIIKQTDVNAALYSTSHCNKKTAKATVKYVSGHKTWFVNVKKILLAMAYNGVWGIVKLLKYNSNNQVDNPHNKTKCLRPAKKKCLDKQEMAFNMTIATGQTRSC